MSSLRALVSIVTILGWFVASNHCALGFMAPSLPATKVLAHAPTDHEHCSGHLQKPGQKEGGDTAQCCKALQTPAIQFSKAGVPYDASLHALQLIVFCSLIRPDDDASSPVLELDTGPPGSFSFAETVLQRSILA